MPEADAFEAPQGGTFHERLLEAITEAFAGNGITNNGDALVTADDTEPLRIDVSAASGLRYEGESYSPAAESFDLSAGPTTTTNGEDDRRADLLYFDATDGTDGSYAVLEGDADPNPVPPDTPDDGLAIAVIDVEHDADDVADDDIINWRAYPAATYQVDADEIADDAVVRAKIGDAAVGTDELGTAAVTNEKVDEDAVDTDEIADDAVVSVKIAEDAVGSTELQDEITIVELSVSDYLQLVARDDDPDDPDTAQLWLRQDTGILKWFDGTVTKASGREH